MLQYTAEPGHLIYTAEVGKCYFMGHEFCQYMKNNSPRFLQVLIELENVDLGYMKFYANDR